MQLSEWPTNPPTRGTVPAPALIDSWKWLGLNLRGNWKGWDACMGRGSQQQQQGLQVLLSPFHNQWIRNADGHCCNEHAFTDMHYTLHSTFKMPDSPSEEMSSPPPSDIYRISFRGLEGRKEITLVPLRTLLGAKPPSRHPDWFFSLPDISICKLLKTFLSHAVSFSQQAATADESTTTLHYQKWALGLNKKDHL